MRRLETKRSRLIVIKDDALNIQDVTNISVRCYLERFTYIEQLSSHFHTQLLCCLPQTVLHRTDEVVLAGMAVLKHGKDAFLSAAV
jgi:hypothetical protein